MGEGGQVLRRLDRVVNRVHTPFRLGWVVRKRNPSSASSSALPLWIHLFSARPTHAMTPATPMTHKRPDELRSHRWFGVHDLRSFGHRSRLRQFGYDSEDWNGKPIIGIINTWSDINACHGHLRARAED